MSFMKATYAQIVCKKKEEIINQSAIKKHLFSNIQKYDNYLHMYWSKNNINAINITIKEYEEYLRENKNLNIILNDNILNHIFNKYNYKYEDKYLNIADKLIIDAIIKNNLWINSLSMDDYEHFYEYINHNNINECIINKKKRNSKLIKYVKSLNGFEKMNTNINHSFKIVKYLINTNECCNKCDYPYEIYKSCGNITCYIVSLTKKYPYNKLTCKIFDFMIKKEKLCYVIICLYIWRYNEYILNKKHFDIILNVLNYGCHFSSIVMKYIENFYKELNINDKSMLCDKIIKEYYSDTYQHLIIKSDILDKDEIFVNKILQQKKLQIEYIKFLVNNCSNIYISKILPHNKKQIENDYELSIMFSLQKNHKNHNIKLGLNDCLLCTEKSKNHIYYCDCKHVLIICNYCYKSYTSIKKCAVCRTKNKSIHKLFMIE